jgi:hypothetical protein
VILYHARAKVLKETGLTQLTRAHRQAIVEAIESFRRKKPVTGEAEMGTPGSPFIEAECMDEATNSCSLAFGNVAVPLCPLECFSVMDESVPPDCDEPFWKLLRATKKFYERHSVLPHYGDCPDMEAHPDFFRRQREIYREFSKKNWEEVLADVPGEIDPKYVARFAKNVWRVGAVAYQPLPFYLDKRPVTEYWDDSSRDNFNRYSCVQVLFIAARKFLQRTGRNPGIAEEDQKAMLDDILEMGAKKIAASEAETLTAEFCRMNGTVLPSVVASLAAIVAEEATKLIIRQAKPCNGLVVYDAIHGLLVQPE